MSDLRMLLSADMIVCDIDMPLINGIDGLPYY